MENLAVVEKKSPFLALKWIPVLLLLAFQFRLTSSYVIYGPYVVIPLAAFLGHKYGKGAIWTVVLGGMLFPIGLKLGAYSSGRYLDLYLLAIITCYLASSPRSLQQWLPKLTSKKLLIAALILFPMAIVFYEGELFEDLPVILGFDFFDFLVVFLFAMGAAGRSAKSVIVALVVAGAIGITLKIMGWPPRANIILDAQKVYLPLLGLSELKNMGGYYTLNSTIDLLTCLGYFWSGYILYRFWEKGSIPATSKFFWFWLFLAGFFALSSLDYYLLIRELDWPRSPLLNITKSTLLLVLVCFMAGLLGKRRGLGFMVGMVVLFWVLNGIAISGFNFTRPYILFRPMEIVYVFSFGSLGIWLRNQLVEEEQAALSWNWFWYTLSFSALVFFAQINRFSLFETLLLLTIPTAIISLSMLTGYLRNRYSTLKVEGHGGWVSLLGMIFVAYLGWQKIGEVQKGFHELYKQLQGMTALSMHELLKLFNSELGLFILFFLLYIWVLLNVLETALKSFTSWVEDFKQLWFWLKKLIKRDVKITIRLSPQKEDSADPDARTVLRFIFGGIRYVNRTLLSIIIVLPLTLLVIEVYPEQGLLAKSKEFYTDNFDTPSKVPKILLKIPDECKEYSANPYLWQAAIEYIGDKPLIEADPCGYKGRITTDWFITGQTPPQQTQLTFYIGRKMAVHGVDLYTQQKEKRLGVLWVEPESNDDDQTERITQDIYKRADTLANQEENRLPE